MKNRLPAWFRQELPQDKVRAQLDFLSESGLNTVCREAKCPNLNRCFNESQLTFMILGDTCTRNCRFCAVGKSSGGALDIDLDEPQRIKEAAVKLGLRFVVITSVTRDDLADGGAQVFAKSIRLLREYNPEVGVEVLIPDFRGTPASIKTVADAKPNVIAHNLETVSRLYDQVRPKADYKVSLSVLSKIKELNPYQISKSSIMLGLGEREDEVIEAMIDLRKNSCDILTLGQYLAPSKDHYPVKEFISLEKFEKYRRIAIGFGFKTVASGPLVRSSYQAQAVYKDSLCMI
ncbi:lipoyl synthase [Candidatus Omnitrophota bacterium]